MAAPLEHDALSHAAGHHEHASPTRRLFDMLRRERKDISALIAFTLVTALLSLALPLAVQALVNTIAQGVFLQPLIVLAAFVFLCVLAAGCLYLIQMSISERLQQRIFAGIALHLAQNMVRIRATALPDVYVPEMVNRFFDVMTIQKALSKLLLDGLATAIAAMFGLILMAFYSYWLLAFDIVLVFGLLFVLVVLGYGGLRSSVKESYKKYEVAGWLEDLARCHTNLKINGNPDHLVRRADSVILAYITARRSHFRVLYRQAFGNYVLQALALTGMLAIGGYLVINRSLTLGQLVAAQLIVMMVLTSAEKLVKQCEHVFDLLTGLDKVGHATDLPLERRGGIPLPLPKPGEARGLSVEMRDVYYTYAGGNQEVLSGVSLKIAAGGRVAVVGGSGAGKSTVSALIAGFDHPRVGSVVVGGQDVLALDLPNMRHAIGLVDDTDGMFSGTLEENIVVGREGISSEDVEWAVRVAQFSDDVASLKLGLKTTVVSGGRNFSRGQRQRIAIARAIVSRPRLLILDEAFSGIEEEVRQRILDELYSEHQHWTIITITHLDEVVVRASQVFLLKDGRIAEQGETAVLRANCDSAFASLFPFLCGRTGQNDDRSLKGPTR